MHCIEARRTAFVGVRRLGGGRKMQVDHVLIGQTFGPFRVLDLLGKGGMGEVYRAHDTALDRDVALKTLPPHLTHDPDRLARLKREARLLAAPSPVT